MDNRTRLERLRMLLDLMENHHKYFKERDIKFDISEWVEDYVDAPAQACGTAACALGSAALYPKFIKQGLYMHTTYPKYNGLHGYAAGAEFFGIEYGESEFLFDPEEYRVRTRHYDYPELYKGLKWIDKVKPSHVATRIKRLIKKYEEV